MSKYLGPNKFMVELTPEQENEVRNLKAEIAERQKKVRQLDPKSAPGGKRAMKRDKIMDNLVELSLANKELKRVGWMNSKEAAEDYIAKANQKHIDKGGELLEAPYRDWHVREEEITGDGVPDIIIYDANDSIRGLNGNTITKSKYPERKQYYKDNPKAEGRRARYDPMTGQPLNFDGKDEQGRVKNPQYTTKQNFHENVYKAINVDQRTGEYGWANEQTRRLVKMTPYKIFVNKILKDYWEKSIKPSAVQVGIPKHFMARFYGFFKTDVWDYFKYLVVTEARLGGLGEEMPNNEAATKLLYESRRFKDAQELVVKNLLKLPDQDIWQILKPGADKSFNDLEQYAGGE